MAGMPWAGTRPRGGARLAFSRVRAWAPYPVPATQSRRLRGLERMASAGIAISLQAFVRTHDLLRNWIRCFMRQL
jgi:hypothetical protein